MKTIAYSSPFIPVEWIAAHGLRPHWLRPGTASGGPSIAVTRGICPFAGAIIDAALSGIASGALVLTTVCDQMRYAAAVIESRGNCPVFLLNVPSTWQTAQARKLYLDELLRLGRFLLQLGGNPPGDAGLAEVMLAYDRARGALLTARDRLSAREFAEAAAEVRGCIVSEGVSEMDSPIFADHASMVPGKLGQFPPPGIPLAVLGGPLLEPDYTFFDLIERAGGRVALDATEGGERTLPRRFDPVKVASAPFQELCEAYFDHIVDAFRRPDSGLFEWLGRELAARKVRGIIFRRYVWCDLWHAELHRLKNWSPLPVLEIDTESDDGGASNRIEGRIEAFLEMLR
ncbi:MAG: 2-hydroxyacyl-CoA dehydratase family protein [Thermoguttaceae bacterium]|jgi:benzoyl-CoA reductase/2-hydroxyglutaryl-CoA dehydratase subunit BcrC/BadD/HgdB